LSIVDADRDWVAMLPEVLGPTERPACGGTRWWRPAPATTWPEPWGVGLSSGDVAVSLGTSGTVYSVADRPATDPSGAVAGFADATSRFLPLVCTLNATKVTEAVRRLLDFDHGVFDELALAAPAGAAGLTLLSVLRWVNVLRTEPTQPAYYRDCGVTSAASNWPGGRGRRRLRAARRSRCAVTRRVHHRRPTGRRGGGSRSTAYRRVLADLAGRPVLVPHGIEHVAAGACVQAAAVLTGSEPADVADRWGLGDGSTTEPGPAFDAAPEVRAAYAALRDATATA
jgi:xylulokinase